MCTVQTPLTDVPRFEAFSASIRNLSKLFSFAAASTILTAALGFVARKSGLGITLTVSSCRWESTVWFASHARG